MFKSKLPAVLLLLSVLMMMSSSFAQPNISGPQSGTLGPGTYIVVGDIRVVGGETLTIVPGTEFLHTGHHTWEINGQLNAEGAEGDSISFLRQFPNEDCKWGGIRFLPGASAFSTIDYCIIDHCKNGTFPYSTYGGGVYTYQVGFTLSNTRISNCEAYWDGGGIYANNANITIINCLIVDNTAISGANGGGIYLNNCAEAQVLNSIIARNSDTGT
ncbi:MAG: right-handed parallel beta-helix repeat-containing protein [candidate division Zixibacteria bacterium]|nr:right-handed parallel beta-helix repeat-containing protein [Candidatus Tariuqbacter arcticus]